MNQSEKSQKKEMKAEKYSPICEYGIIVLSSHHNLKRYASII